MCFSKPSMPEPPAPAVIPKAPTLIDAQSSEQETKTREQTRRKLALAMNSRTSMLDGDLFNQQNTQLNSGNTSNKTLLGQ